MIAMKITVICVLFCVLYLDGACCARLKRQVQKPSQDVPFSEDYSSVSTEDMNVDDYDSILSFFDQPLVDTLSPYEVRNQASAAPVASFSEIEPSLESSTKNRDTSNEPPVEVSESNTKSSSEEVFLTKESDIRSDVTKSATSKEDKDPSSTSDNESVSSNEEDSSSDSSSSQSTSTKGKDCSSSESSSSDSKESSSTSSNSEDSSSSIQSKNKDSSSSESTSSNSKDSSSDSSSSESTSSNSKDSSKSMLDSSNDKNLSTDSSKSTSSSGENSDDSSTEEEEKSIEEDISDDEPAKETHLNPKVQGMNIALYYILQNLNRRMLFDQKIEFESLVKVLALTYKIENAGGTVIDFNELMLKNIIGAFPKALRDALNADSDL